MSGPTPSVHILIVLYNSARWIAPTLRAVGRSRWPGAVVWVLDNASRDDGAEIVARDFPWARLLRGTSNRGFAGGNNDLAKRALAEGADYLFLLNPDTEIAPDCVERLVEALRASPHLGVAGCRILQPDGVTLDHLGGRLSANALPSHAGRGRPDDPNMRGLIDADYVQGAAMMIPAAVWRRLGGFDEAFNPAYFEEADLCRRARDMGLRVAVVAEASLIHFQEPEKQVQSPTFLKLLFRGRARYVRKHYGAAAWIFRFLPAELLWLRSPDSKGYRRIACRAMIDALLGRRDEFDR